MASAVVDGKIGAEQRFDTAAGRSLVGCACAAGIAVVLIVADAADVVLIEHETYLIGFPVVVVVHLAAAALNAAYQDVSVEVTD